MPVALLGVLFTVAGFIMFVLEVVRALTGSVLGGVGEILLWTGLGLLAVGLILLVVSLAIAGPSQDELAADDANGVEVVKAPKAATPRKTASARASRPQPADTAPAPRPRARRAADPAPAATTEDPPPLP